MPLVYLQGLPSLGFLGARRLTTPPPPTEETPPAPTSPFNFATAASSALATAVKEMTTTPPPPPPAPAASNISSIGSRASSALATAVKEMTTPQPVGAKMTPETFTMAPPAPSSAEPVVATMTPETFTAAPASSGSSVAYGSGSSVGPDVGVWTSSGPSPGSHVAQTDAASSPLREALRELTTKREDLYAPELPGGGGVAGVPVPEKRILGFTPKQLAIAGVALVVGYVLLGGAKGGA